MKGANRRWLSQHRLTIFSTVAVITLLIGSVVIIPRAISSHATPNIVPKANYIPSNAFGDTDDLPAGSISSSRLKLAAGSASVSGVITDASTGQPVANAQIGISTGTVGG